MAYHSGSYFTDHRASWSTGVSECVFERLGVRAGGTMGGKSLMDPSWRANRGTDVLI